MIDNFFYYGSQWILACKYFQTTNEARNYPIMSVSELKSLNKRHRFLLFGGLFVILTCCCVFEYVCQAVVYGLWIIILVPIVAVMGYSLYEVYKLVENKPRMSVMKTSMFTHVLLLGTFTLIGIVVFTT